MAPYHFASGFNRYFYNTHLPKNGFEVIELQENGNFFEYLAQELRRLRGVATRYAQDALDQDESDAVHTVLTALQRFSGRDVGSKELLCFGYHVVARKVGEGTKDKEPAPGAPPEKRESAKPQAAGESSTWLNSLNHALRATARRQPPPTEKVA